MPEIARPDGGVYLYRATATCTLCGRTDDVGPFEMVTDAAVKQLPEWILPTDLRFVVSDGFGTPITICPDCAEKPVREVRHAFGVLRG